MGWGRKSRFFGTTKGSAVTERRSSGDQWSGLKFEGGGWQGFVNVNIHAQGDEDWVRITVTDHPWETQEYCVELYAGPLNAKSVYKYKKQLRRRRALNEAKAIVRRMLNKTDTVIPADVSAEDNFYHDELEQSGE